MKYAYFPGCALESTAKEYDISSRTIFAKLNIDLYEIPDWTCCGSTPSHQVSNQLSVALPIKNLIWPEKEKLDVVAPCASCYSRLKLSNITVQNDSKLRDKINQIIGDDYHGKVKIFNILDVLNQEVVLDTIKKNIKKNLSGLKIACYYGCLLTRPREIVDAVSIENPVSMDNICKTLGAEPLEWPYKTECCGASFSITSPEIVIKLTHDILEMAKAAGADCVAVACPLCQSNLDMRQSKIEKEYNTKFNLPIVYITQLVGLALGIPYKELGLDKLIVEPYRVLETKGLLK